MSRTLAIIAALLWLLLLSAYPKSIFIAAVTAILTIPIYRWLRARVKKELAVGVFLGGLILCVGIPIAIVIIMVIPKVSIGVHKLSLWWNEGHQIPASISHLLDSAHAFLITHFPQSADIIAYLNDTINNAGAELFQTVLSASTSSLGSLASLLGNVVGVFGILVDLCFFTVFTCLFAVYAPVIFKTASLILPEHIPMLERFSVVLYNASKSVFISIVFVPIIQGILTGIGLSIFEISDPVFWGLLAVFVAVIPVAGTGIIWLPTAIYLIATGSIARGIGLIVWGIVVVSGADNILRPYFLKTGIDVSMSVLLLSIICSVTVLGPIGIIAGPIIVAVARQALLESEMCRSC